MKLISGWNKGAVALREYLNLCALTHCPWAAKKSKVKGGVEAYPAET